MTPPITVIVPTYNRCAILGRAIQSVLAQTVRDWELLVVDDCSTDETAGVVDACADERIRRIRHPSRKGASAARNTGIAAARGTYIAFLDSDDEWTAQKLRTQLDFFAVNSGRVGLLYCAYMSITPGGVTEFHPRVRGNVTAKLLVSNPIGGGGSLAMIPKCVFDAVGVFDETLTARQDLDMWLRISQRYEIDYIDECLARIYHTSSSRISTNIDAGIGGFERFYEKHKQLITTHRCVGKYMLYAARITLGRTGRKDAAMAFLTRAIADEPCGVTNYYNYLRYLLFKTGEK